MEERSFNGEPFSSSTARENTFLHSCSAEFDVWIVSEGGRDEGGGGGGNGGGAIPGAESSKRVAHWHGCTLACAPSHTRVWGCVYVMGVLEASLRREGLDRKARGG